MQACCRKRGFGACFRKRLSMALDKVRNLLSKPSWFKLDQKGWLKDFLIGFILVLSLGLFINSKEIHVDHLELNSTSNKYILAQTEFDFPDTAATRLLKEESIRDLGKIYYLQDTEILK